MNQMELILFTTNFPLGSSEQFLECEILYLAKSFTKITIIPLTDSGIPRVRNIPDNVTFFAPMLPVSLNDKTRLFRLAFFNRQPIKMFLVDFFKNRAYSRKSWFLNWLSFSSIARAAMQSDSFKKMRSIVTPSALFYFYWGDKSSTLCPLIKKEFPGNKFIARFHGTDLYETKTPGYMPFREDLLRNIDLAVFISSNGKEFLINRYPLLSLNTIISRLGVNEKGDGFPSTDGILRIVTCSNVVKIKQLHLLAEALRLIDFKADWTHIGDGEQLEALKELAGGLPSEVHVLFKGALSNSDVIQFYREHAVDLFVNVSKHEGLPVSIMEAISFGIPVIAPAVGGIPEIVQNDHGFLMSGEPTPREIAGTLTRFVNLSPGEKETMRKEAKRYWKNHFDADDNYTDFCEKIKLLVDEHLI
jgi:colanic acid/amylovoran biosynthesis glycosyltransferase